MDPMIVVVLFLVGAVLIWWFNRQRGQGPPDSQIDEALAAGAALIDVRNVGEFAIGHAPGARNIPVDELGLRLADVGEAPATVVVYCRTGMRSSRAATILTAAGFTVLNARTLGQVERILRDRSWES